MLEIRQLTKTFAARSGAEPVAALRGISLNVAAGEFFALLGPSGCGKTTLLQSIAGLETPDDGSIEIAGVSVLDQRSGLQVPANRRGIGMVFQSYAIWPHMSVFENVAFPLVHGRDHGRGGDVRKRVLEALALVKLADHADRPAPHLSGGQQQRVALARAIVNQPRLILLDEPLSNLDAKLRHSMRDELRQLIKTLGLTAIFVTHDQTEALAMADRVALMRAGEIVQIGAPDEIYFQPQTAFAASFMGGGNLLEGRVIAVEGERVLKTAIGRVVCAIPEALDVGAAAIAVLRPHAIAAVSPPNAGVNCFRATVRRTTFLGDVVEAEVAVGETILRLHLNSFERASQGQELPIRIAPERCVVVPADGEVAA